MRSPSATEGLVFIFLVASFLERVEKFHTVANVSRVISHTDSCVRSPDLCATRTSTLALCSQGLEKMLGSKNCL